jgi:MFS transporter, AAHS family, 3-hydroxyphenylpropionic acid transporter
LPNSSTTRRTRTILWLCAACALVEGFDNQSAGVAAPRMIPEFGLLPGQAGIVFSAAALGLFAGAAIGGRLADRLGRKRTLVLSLAVFGLFSLLTTVAPSYALLVAARFLTGLGLGGAMPNFIALASGAVEARRRIAVVAIVTAAMPLGGATAAITALADRLGWGWRSIFYVGGTAPLFIAVLLWLLLPDDRRERVAVAVAADSLAAAGANPGMPLESVPQVLFGGARAWTTVSLWGGFFFTQLILLLMLNWLPSLMIGLGYTRAQGSVASLLFNVAGATGGILLGRMHVGRLQFRWVLTSYLGIAAALLVLPFTGHSFGLAAAAVMAAGVFIIGAQLILFAAAPLYYRAAVRGTGVGGAVAVGRLGSVVGPLFAGALLAAGSGGAGVLLGILPFVAVAGAATLALCARPLADSSGE